MASNDIPGSGDRVDRIVTVGVEAVDWTTQADEWAHRAGESLGDGGRATVTGSRYDATTQPFIEITVSSFDDHPTASRFSLPHSMKAACSWPSVCRSEMTSTSRSSRNGGARREKRRDDSVRWAPGFSGRPSWLRPSSASQMTTPRCDSPRH